MTKFIEESIKNMRTEAALANAAIQIEDMKAFGEHHEKCITLMANLIELTYGEDAGVPFDLRKIWISQLDFCKAVAEDIIKNNASVKCLTHIKLAYPDLYISAPFNFKYRNDESADTICVNLGEAYVHIQLDEANKPTGEIYWCNDEMHVFSDAATSYEKTINEIMSRSAGKTWDMIYETDFDPNYYYKKEDENTRVYEPFRDFVETSHICE